MVKIEVVDGESGMRCVGVHESWMGALCHAWADLGGDQDLEMLPEFLEASAEAVRQFDAGAESGVVVHVLSDMSMRSFELRFSVDGV